MMNQEVFGVRLRRLRHERGLSQTQLAGAGLSPSYISLLEAGRRAPTPAAVGRLAQRLGCDPQLLTEGVSAFDASELQLQLRYAELALQSDESAEAVERFRTLAERGAETPSHLRAEARWGHARALEATGDIEAAIVAYETLRQEADANPQHMPWVQCVIALCRCYQQVGDLAHSIELGDRAQARVLELGLAGTDVEVDLGATLVGCYLERGDVVSARMLADRVMDAAELLENPRARGAAYWSASLIAQELGRTVEALHLAEKALASFTQVGDARNRAQLRTAYAGLLLRLDPPQFREARPLLVAAVDQLTDRGREDDLACAETELARVELLSGSADEAVNIAQRALDRLGVELRLEAARARLVLGHAEAARGDEAAAVLAYARAATDLSAMRASRQAAAGWRELAESFNSLGRVEQALDAYREAATAAGITAPPAIARQPEHPRG